VNKKIQNVRTIELAPITEIHYTLYNFTYKINTHNQMYVLSMYWNIPKGVISYLHTSLDWDQGGWAWRAGGSYGQH